MKKKDMKIGKLRHCIGGLVGLPMVLAAQNPIVQTMYTADPAPMVYDGKLFLYTSHDEDASTWFVMNEWKLYSTTDMVNWTDHGLCCLMRLSHGQKEMPGQCNAWNATESFTLTFP